MVKQVTSGGWTKQNNQIEEKDADAIGISLYEGICEWAIEDGTSRGIVLWACSVAQWNCMGRPINIDSLGFHNIRKSPAGGDSVVLFYDKNDAAPVTDAVMCWMRCASPVVDADMFTDASN